MASSNRTGTVLWFAVTTLVSAFLVFQIQPVVSKTVLPWFGGSPAVWTTCMLFFQGLLFAGYAYAHLSIRLLSPRWQGFVHFLIVATALWLLPITPGNEWKPNGAESPIAHLLLILTATVGLPYFLLSSTGPLLQAWFSQQAPDKSPYRLYALSNAGSLAALLTYPFLVEPAFTTRSQGALWSVGFCCFAITGGYLAARLWSVTDERRAKENESSEPSPSFNQYLVWLALPAIASVVLLATTNHLCQDIAVVPFLWIAPLSLYLLTFIICFDREHWYKGHLCGGLATVAAVGLCIMVEKGLHMRLLIETLAYLGLLFWTCMVCHGELVRSKPHPRFLTTFYLLSSLGGALGGLFVAVLCPLIFTTHFEMNLCIVAAAMVGLIALFAATRERWLDGTRPRQLIAGLAATAVLLYVGMVQLVGRTDDQLESVRNFYGVLHVGSSPDKRGTMMIHGRTTHGFQFADASQKSYPTTYYGPASGVGLTLAQKRAAGPLKVGVVGLGVGTLATYGRTDDLYRFYEINPSVVQLAKERFSFLADSAADHEVILGDARLSLEAESAQQYDVLVLDAFSSDSIPTHLLTSEAFEVYRRHMAADGVIAVHISNRNLRLDEVVAQLADHVGMRCARVLSRDHKPTSTYAAKWMLLTSDLKFLESPPLARVARYPSLQNVHSPKWTDQYNNLLQILTVF